MDVVTQPNRKLWRKIGEERWRDGGIEFATFDTSCMYESRGSRGPWMLCGSCVLRTESTVAGIQLFLRSPNFITNHFVSEYQFSLLYFLIIESGTSAWFISSRYKVAKRAEDRIEKTKSHFNNKVCNHYSGVHEILNICINSAFIGHPGPYTTCQWKWYYAHNRYIGERYLLNSHWLLYWCYLGVVAAGDGIDIDRTTASNSSKSLCWAKMRKFTTDFWRRSRILLKRKQFIRVMSFYRKW